MPYLVVVVVAVVFLLLGIGLISSAPPQGPKERLSKPVRIGGGCCIPTAVLLFIGAWWHHGAGLSEQGMIFGFITAMIVFDWAFVLWTFGGTALEGSPQEHQIQIPAGRAEGGAPETPIGTGDDIDADD